MNPAEPVEVVVVGPDQQNQAPLRDFLVARSTSPSGLLLGWAARRNGSPVGIGTLEDPDVVLAWAGLTRGPADTLVVSENSDGSLLVEAGPVRVTLTPLGPVASALLGLCSPASALWIDEQDPSVQVRVATWCLLWSASPDMFADAQCVTDRDFLTVGMLAAYATARDEGSGEFEAALDLGRLARLPDRWASALVDALVARHDDEDERGAKVAIEGVNEALRAFVALPADERARFLDILERHPDMSVAATQAAHHWTCDLDSVLARQVVDLWSLSPSADVGVVASLELVALGRALAGMDAAGRAHFEDLWSASNPLSRDVTELVNQA